MNYITHYELLSLYSNSEISLAEGGCPHPEHNTWVTSDWLEGNSSKPSMMSDMKP